MNTRELALRILMDIDRREAKSHLALQDTWTRHPELTDQERRFLLRLVQGTLEKQILLDYRIDQVSATKVKKMKPAIRSILRMGAYQIFFMDSVPDAAVCNESVKLAQKMKMQGLKGFVNGVLRGMIRKTDWKEEPEDIRYSLPRWIAERWKEVYGEERALKMMQSLDQPGRLYFRIHSSMVEVQTVLDSMNRQGVRAQKAEFPADAWYMEGMERLEQLEALQKGWIQIQDISSMMVGALAGIQENWNILDVCAAPGGKSIHAAELLRGTGHVTACDLTEQKVQRILENISRTGLKNIHAVVQDATQYRPEWDGVMDLVLADLPCSGLGVMARKPEIRYNVTRKDVEELAALQRQILKNVVRYVKPGGILVFSTCTVAPEENIQNRQWILENLPLKDAGFREEDIPEGLMSETIGGSLQLLPGVHEGDGFYLARFVRTEE